MLDGGAELVGADLLLVTRTRLEWFSGAFSGEDARQRRSVHEVSPDAMRALLQHAWPGNVRELRNVVEYAFAVGRGESLRAEDLPPELAVAGAAAALPGAAGAPSEPEDETGRVREALALSGGRVSEAAARLGVSRATFWRMRKRLGL